MNEQSPKQESKHGFVPDYIFDKAWQEGNFLIPADKGLRIELRMKLEGFSHYGVMEFPENHKAKEILLARIAAIDAYDSKLKNSK